MGNVIKCVEGDKWDSKDAFSKHRIHKKGETGICKNCIELLMPVERVCSKCNETKNMCEFGVLTRNKFGRNGICLECYVHKMSKYYSENTAHDKVVKKIYRDKNKVETAKKDKLYRKQNKSQIRIQCKKYREINKKVIAHKKKMYYASDAGRAGKRAGEKKRVIQIRATDDGSITKISLDELYTEQDAKCYICECDLTQLKRSRVHIDHIIPLIQGGGHVLENVAWSCASCNISKGGKL